MFLNFLKDVGPPWHGLSNWRFRIVLPMMTSSGVVFLTRFVSEHFSLDVS